MIESLKLEQAKAEIKRLNEELEQRVIERTSELRESEERFRQVADNIREVLWLYTPDYRKVLYISPAYESVWGRTTESLHREPYSFLEAVHPHDRARVEETVRRERARGVDHEYRVVRPDGTVRWVWDRGFPIKDRKGRVYRIAGIAKDITGRKLTEERITLLQTITMDVTAAQDLPSALEVVLRRVCEKTGWALGQAWVPQEDGTGLDCCPAWFATVEGLEEFRDYSRDITISPGSGLPGRVWASRQSAWIRDVTQDTNFPRAEFARKCGLKAALGVPILSGDEVIAVLEFFLSGPREEDERLVKVIAAIAAQIGLVIERKHAEERLRWSEERLRLLLDSTAEGIFGVDLEGRCTFCNAASLRLLGYDRLSELLGKDMHALIAHSRPDGTPYPIDECRVVHSLQAATSCFAEDDVFWRKDRVSFPAEYWSYPMFQGNKHIGAVVTFLDITERKKAEEKVRATSEQLRALSASLQSAREEEGTRIAREIHDELGSTLTTLKWDLEGFDKILSDAENLPQLRSLQERIESMTGLIDRTIKSVRRISSELRPRVLDDLGLVAAISWQARQFGERSGIVCHCDFMVESLDLTRAHATALFRIFQEALTNILRHAKATQVETTLAKGTAEIILAISDNGRGITEDEASGQLSLGLLGMRERVYLIGGEIDIAGIEGKGTTITVRVPLSDAPL